MLICIVYDMYTHDVVLYVRTRTLQKTKEAVVVVVVVVVVC